MFCCHFPRLFQGLPKPSKRDTVCLNIILNKTACVTAILMVRFLSVYSHIEDNHISHFLSTPTVHPGVHEYKSQPHSQDLSPSPRGCTNLLLTKLPCDITGRSLAVCLFCMFPLHSIIGIKMKGGLGKAVTVLTRTNACSLCDSKPKSDHQYAESHSFNSRSFKENLGLLLQVAFVIM